jgi:tripartite-type tricarboxylate transporter receptor subunit TctC
MVISRRHSLLALAACSGLPWVHAQAQDFPTKPIRLVCGFPPGGSGDFVARTLADEVGRLLGQPLVIENRPGAATNIASELVARAEPDGHTLLLGGSFSHSVNPALFTKLPYDAGKDFAPVIKVASLPTVFAVPASLNVNTLQAFITLAKEQGAKWNYASAGIGSPGHIAGGYLGGEVQLTITSPPSVMPLVKEGRLKALALTTPGRSKLLPDIPGSDEAGLKDFNLDGWYGVFAPARTPAATVQKIHAAFAAVLNNPAIVSKLEAQAAAPEPSASVEAFTAFVASNRIAWEQVVKRSGAQVN